MKTNRFFPWACVLAVALSSCAEPGKIVQGQQPNPAGVTGRPLIRVKDPESGTAVAPGGNVADKPLIGFPSDDEIAFTDADNPESGIPELATLLAAPKRGPWEESETIAKQRSSREGKPLLIWFTNSQSSPMCKAISQELFSTNEFGTWAAEKLVRLRVDAFVKITDPNTSIDDAQQLEYKIKDYNEALKKRYKIMGYPSLVMLSPSGEVVGSYRGYKRGDAEFRFGQLKHAEAVSAESYKGWRSGLEKKGYREWKDRKDRKIFARLISYNQGTLNFIEPDGTRSRTKEESLSDEDRSWIADQKKLRKLQ
jgi:thioredoxin-related protein